MAQPRSDPPTAEPPRQRSRYWWIKWLLGAGLLALLTVEGIYLWPTLSDSWKALTEIHWGWVAACIAAQAVSLSGYGAVQQRLLQAGGVVVSQLKSVSVIYASTAMAVSLPAGQVFSTAFTYKQTRKWVPPPHRRVLAAGDLRSDRRGQPRAARRRRRVRGGHQGESGHAGTVAGGRVRTVLRTAIHLT